MSRTLLLVLALLATGGLYYLGQVDRLSPLAMNVVELQTTVGFAPWLIGLGLVVLAAANVALAPRAPAPVTRQRDPRQAPARRSPAPSPVRTDGDWYAAAVQAARAMPLEPQGKLRVSEAVGVPFTLVLQRATVEQARRRLDTYAAFLASIPTPPKGRVYIESSPDIQIAPTILVGAALKKHLPADSYYVMEHGGAVDIVFPTPDPRWASQG